MTQQQAYYVYVGTYTRGEIGRGKAEGIYIFRWQPRSASLEPVGVTPGVANPSFLTIAPNRKHLYAINEIHSFGGKTSGAVSAFAIDPASGALALLNQQATQGPGSCYVSLDQSGKWALVANYRGGSASVLPILEDRTLGAPTAFVQHSGPSRVDPRRQEAAHAHSIIAAPGNRVVLVADLGMDKIMLYRLDGKTGALAPHDPPFIAARPGAGPRHQVFHPSGRFLYVVNELDSTVAVLAWDSARARGQEVQAISTLPHGYISPSTCAEIRISPSGKFVYASNRGHDSLAIFAVDAANGKLAAAGHVFTQGKTPRNFELTPTGDVLLAANQDSDTIVPFWVDQATGQLTPTGNVTSVPTPVCVRMMATP